MTRPPPNPPEDLTAAVRWLQAENENLRAEIERLKAGMHEYACTGTDHPCGCYDQFLSEKAEIERLGALAPIVREQGFESERLTTLLAASKALKSGCLAEIERLRTENADLKAKVAYLIRLTDDEEPKP